MSKRPEALRLADALSAAIKQVDADDDVIHVARWFVEDADAELRRLSAENERLHQINQSHEMKLSVRGYEIQIADLEAQRDALLEALHAIVRRVNGAASYRMGSDIDALARAAIKAVEERK